MHRCTGGKPNHLKLAGAQHYQRTGLLRSNALLLQQVCQLVIFGTGIENDPLRPQRQNVVVVSGLPRGVDVQRNRVYTFQRRMIGNDIDAGYAAWPKPDGYDRVAVGYQPVGGYVAVAIALVGRTDNNGKLRRRIHGAKSREGDWRWMAFLPPGYSPRR